MKWAADFAVALEVTEQAIDLVLRRVIDTLRAAGQLNISRRLGRIGQFDAELQHIRIDDLKDPPPIGAVVGDLLVDIDVRLQLFRFIRLSNTLRLVIDDVEVDLTRTAAGLPKGVVIRITPSLRINIRLTQPGFFARFIFNAFVGPLVSVGVWLAFRIIREVNIPIWELVDAFNALGITYAQGSPLLTAQRATAPESLLLASDFSFTNPIQGNANQLASFIPAQTNTGIVIHERTLNSAVNIVFARGMVPSRFSVDGLKIYINGINVAFEQDKIKVTGGLKAKRKRCWCRVKVKLSFDLEVEPRIVDTQTNAPKMAFNYAASASAHVSTGGMVMIMGFIMFAPLFLALTLSLSHLANLALAQFLPFSTQFQRGNARLSVTAASVASSGLIPFAMDFDLDLLGTGEFSLANLQQTNLPGNLQFNIAYTPESLSIQKEELRLAIGLH